MRDEVPVDLSPAAMEGVAALLRRFAERTPEVRYDPRRAHCPACPYGPRGTALCPIERAAARRVG